MGKKNFYVQVRGEYVRFRTNVKTSTPSQAVRYATVKCFKNNNDKEKTNITYRVDVEYDMKTVRVKREYIYTRSKLIEPKIINQYGITVNYETSVKFVRSSSTIKYSSSSPPPPPSHQSQPSSSPQKVTKEELLLYENIRERISNYQYISEEELEMLRKYNDEKPFDSSDVDFSAFLTWDGDEPLQYTRPNLFEIYPPVKIIEEGVGRGLKWLTEDHFVKLGVRKNELEYGLIASEHGIGPPILEYGMYNKELCYIVFPKLEETLAMRYPYNHKDIRQAYELFMTLYKKTGISQQDAKAQNFMFDSNGRMYMIDYGMARIINRPIENVQRNVKNILYNSLFKSEFGENAWYDSDHVKPWLDDISDGNQKVRKSIERELSLFN
jgi:hypothetical protein